MTVAINGIAHLYITVADFEQALPFYRRLLTFLEMECLVHSSELYYCVGGRTGIGIRRARTTEAFDPYRAGLHHVCLRARSAEDVARIAAVIPEFGGRIVHGPQDDDWAPGYHSVLFEDPGGTRIEVNYVPGKGNLATEISLPLPQDMQERLSEP